MRQAKFLAGLSLAAAALGVATADAGFRSPGSLVRNVYAHYGNGSSEFSNGLPRDDATARQFFDPGLRNAWTAPHDAPYDFLVQSPTWRLGAVSIAILRRQFDKTYVTARFDNQGRTITLNFIVVNGPEGWVISDVESPHDSLRLFLAQFRR
ncbi:hypothetical protein UP10_01575 [Bradyrhizobium sp. LTSPM299]|jgi:hypothetical protein|uniref:hypothetical protein n=1 Tax=Bradyrhizobium sp. LTSPM299 TaxID=1619233 RepID=UPI0005C89E80|nr:hypothetical protein [Bradyrhizobium sp. LTSPM299]KJC62100.1 hypothetical protein UP10_01575 [Bradyrhizobium sp. LTSPM299]